MDTLTSFFFSESGFASPRKVLSGSWVAGIIVGTFSLLSPVISTYAHENNCVTDWLCGGHWSVTCCCNHGDPEIDCGWFTYSCSCS